MSTSATLDRDSFQKLLASAFTIQQSQMDGESLSAMVEVGRLITRGELELDEAMHLIVDRTRNLANATEVDIGLSSGVEVPEEPVPEEDDRSSGVFLSHLATTLAEHGVGAVSADLALDLALKDIVERARMATNASAAAIALLRGEDMVCRATTGKSAPELGARLNPGPQLSADCMQNSNAQGCDDTESDSRVDVVACRRLGIRSFLIFPALQRGKLVGLLEIFSPLPKAFGDRDIQTLQALSRQILINVDCALEFSTPPPEEEPRTVDHSTVARFAAFGVRSPEVKTAQFRVWDSLTQLLFILVIALALLLGWMLGRVRWRAAHTKGPPPTGSVSQKAEAPPTLLVTPKPDATAPQPEKSQADPSLPPIHPKTRSSDAPSGGLIVYQGGKVIFRLRPSDKMSPPSPKSGETIPYPSRTPGEPSTPDPALGRPGKANPATPPAG
ncbi:MAG: GAF domain-containing protein [Candidatus Sulfotelmatobacter sp.]